MDEFDYEAHDPEGTRRADSIAAESLAEAVRQLEALNLKVIAIHRRHEDAPIDAASRKFLSNLNDLLNRRSDWLGALEGMAGELPSGVARRQFNRLLQQFRQYDSAQTFLNSPVAVSLLPALASGAGTTHDVDGLSGWVNEVFRMQDVYVRRLRMLAYPALLSFIAIVFVAFFGMLVLPIFQEMFSEFGLSLPAPTLLLFLIYERFSSHFLSTVGVLLLTAIVLVALVRWWRARALTNRLLGVWAAGTYRNLLSMASLVGVLAELLYLEAPLDQALRLAGAASRHRYYELAAGRLATLITQSPEDWQSKLTRTALPPSVLHAVQAGGGTPNIALLRELSQIYAERAQSRHSLLLDSLPMVGVVLIGIVVGFVVIALFMPLVSMVTSLA